MRAAPASYCAPVPPTWFWFVVALVAAGGGALLLLSDRRSDDRSDRPARSSARSSSRARDRRRWAEQKSWEFVESDDVLPSRWRYGTVHHGGHGRALDLATGAVPGPGGRRLAHLFDHEQDGEITGVVAAVRGVATVPVALELRLPSAPLPDDAELDSLGQVGERYAFVAGVGEGRRLLTSEVARTADLVGSDIALVWAEDTWVLAEATPGTGSERMQRVLQALVDLSVALEKAVDGGSGPDTAAAGPAGGSEFDDGDLGDDLGDDAGYDAFDEDDEDHEDLPPEVDDDTTEIPPARDRAGATAPTHRDRPGDIPYDLEHDRDEAETTQPTTAIPRRSR